MKKLEYLERTLEFTDFHWKILLFILLIF